MMVARRSRGLLMVRVAMMPGTAQAKLDSSGMNERPDRPDRAHHAVEQERGARQVARVLEEEQEEEQDEDLRQEHEHAAHAGDHAVDEQAAQQPVGRAAPSGTRPARATPSLIASMGGPAQLNTAWNIRNSVAARMSMPQHRMQQHAVQRIVDRAGRRHPGARTRPGCGALPDAWPRRRRRRARRHVCGAADAVTCTCASRATSPSAPPRRTATVATTGTPELARQRRGVDRDAAALARRPPC